MPRMLLLATTTAPELVMEGTDRRISHVIESHTLPEVTLTSIDPHQCSNWYLNDA